MLAAQNKTTRLIYQANCQLHFASSVALILDEYVSGLDEYGVLSLANYMQEKNYFFFTFLESD